ncbi:putative linoleate 13S-lipoxygenase [Helianthus debilis subsp. tardiflorus]
MKIYVPTDERFGHLKNSDFLAYGVESVLKFLLPEFEAIADDTLNEFDSFEDVMKLYNGGIKLPQGPLLDGLLENISLQMFKELIRSDGEGFAKYSILQVIEGTNSSVPNQLQTNVIHMSQIKYASFLRCRNAWIF